MAEPTKPKVNAKSAGKPKRSVKAPRVRKTETVRERNLKAAAKAEAKANKPKGRIRQKSKKTAHVIFKPLRKPLKFISTPLRTKPMRFIGRTLGRILWPHYFRNSYKEIKQVSWPSRSDTWKLTFAVIIFAVVFGVAAAGADFVFDKIIQRIVFRG